MDQPVPQPPPHVHPPLKSRPHPQPPPQIHQPVPSRTLYVRNLPDRLPKQRLRRLLHAKFSAHGKVVWIVAEKTMKLRGQAFITFEHQSGATAALRSLQADEFMGKTLMIAYAQQVTNRTNTALPRSKREHSHEKNTQPQQLGQQPQDQQQNQTLQGAPEGGAQPVVETVPPNNILFIQNIATTNNVNDLADLFAKFSGYSEIRSVPGNKNIAFVEYLTEHDAAIAMAGLNQQAVGNPPQPMMVNFAKK